jgi:hypothetical protein
MCRSRTVNRRDASIGSLGDAHVHAMAERFFATLEREESGRFWVLG